MKSFAVLGSGSWGTALAFQLARANPHASVKLWGHDPQQQKDMLLHHCNTKYFPNYLLPAHLTPVETLEEAVRHAEGIIIAVPSTGFHDLISKLQTLISTQVSLLSATKGLAPDTGSFLHTLVRAEQAFAVLSGPSFAGEVMAGLPTAITIASHEIKQAEFWQTHLHSDYFRVYTSDDLIGVQLGGAIKNVMAIATGIVDGLGFGANARAALITRGLAEMIRLNQVVGGKQTTLMGLSGVGDLILTCTDNQSRNRRFGIELGKGISVEAAQKAAKYTVEGYHAAKLIYKLAQVHAVDMPLCNTTYQILYEKLAVKQAFHDLLARAPRGE